MQIDWHYECPTCGKTRRIFGGDASGRRKQPEWVLCPACGDHAVPFDPAEMTVADRAIRQFTVDDIADIFELDEDERVLLHKHAEQRRQLDARLGR